MGTFYSSYRLSVLLEVVFIALTNSMQILITENRDKDLLLFYAGCSLVACSCRQVRLYLVSVSCCLLFQFDPKLRTSVLISVMFWITYITI